MFDNRNDDVEANKDDEDNYQRLPLPLLFSTKSELSVPLVEEIWHPYEKEDDEESFKEQGTRRSKMMMMEKGSWK